MTRDDVQRKLKSVSETRTGQLSWVIGWAMSNLRDIAKAIETKQPLGEYDLEKVRTSIAFCEHA